MLPSVYRESRCEYTLYRASRRNNIASSCFQIMVMASWGAASDASVLGDRACYTILEKCPREVRRLYVK